MNKQIIFQELEEQHLVLLALFVSLHPLALTIIEDNCSGCSVSARWSYTSSRRGTQLPAHFIPSGVLWASILASEFSTCLQDCCWRSFRQGTWDWIPLLLSVMLHKAKRKWNVERQWHGANRKLIFFKDTSRAIPLSWSLCPAFFCGRCELKSSLCHHAMAQSTCVCLLE